MLRIDQPRVFPRTMGLVLGFSVVASLAGLTSAEALTKKPWSENSPVQSTQSVAPPVRFFTINAVMAKHDGLRRPTSQSVEMASADSAPRAGVTSDASPLQPIVMPSDEPFGLVTFRAPEGVLWTKWRAITARMAMEVSPIERCKRDEARCSLSEGKFVALLRAANEATTPRARAETVNRGVNQAVHYVSDFQQHGGADVWSSPLQTLRTGLGDCEDYAIAKYSLLLAAGTAEADLKLLLVRDLAVRQDHAVLAVRLDGHWLVLDNRRSTLMVEGRDLQSFMPLFMIDHHGVSLFAAPYAERPHHESDSDPTPAPATDAEMTPGQQNSALPQLL